MFERSVIGVSVADPQLRGRISDYAMQCDTRTIVVAPDDVHARRCSGLIWDLAPVNDMAPQRLVRLRNQCPITPILLYVRPGPGTGPILQQCGVAPLVRLQFQGLLVQERKLLTAGVAWLLSADVRARLDRVVKALFADLPPRMAQFVELVTQRIAVNQAPARDPRVREIARALHVSERTLEQWCAVANLPSPKRMILWLSSLHFALAADCLGVEMDEVASRLGVDGKRLDQRLQALLPVVATLPTTTAQRLDIILHALAARCRLSAERLAAARTTAA